MPKNKTSNKKINITKEKTIPSKEELRDSIEELKFRRQIEIDKRTNYQILFTATLSICVIFFYV